MNAHHLNFPNSNQVLCVPEFMNLLICTRPTSQDGESTTSSTQGPLTQRQTQFPAQRSQISTRVWMLQHPGLDASGGGGPHTQHAGSGLCGIRGARKSRGRAHSQLFWSSWLCFRIEAVSQSCRFGPRESQQASE